MRNQYFFMGTFTPLPSTCGAWNWRNLWIPNGYCFHYFHYFHYRYSGSLFVCVQAAFERIFWCLTKFGELWYSTLIFCRWKTLWTRLYFFQHRFAILNSLRGWRRATERPFQRGYRCTPLQSCAELLSRKPSLSTIYILLLSIIFM